MTKVGIREYPLVEYLAGQLMLSDDDRYNALKEYFPNAKKEDWRLWQAGQRVQIIKRDEEQGGVLKLGTEVVSSADNTIAGLLGASPGASTAAPIMLTVLQKVFKDKVATPEWQTKLHQIVPSYGTKLNDSPEAVAKEWAYTAGILQLTPPPAIPQLTAPNGHAPRRSAHRPNASNRATIYSRSVAQARLQSLEPAAAVARPPRHTHVAPGAAHARHALAHTRMRRQPWPPMLHNVTTYKPLGR